MFSLKLILYFLSFIFLYNIVLWFFSKREGLANRCDDPTPYSNEGRLQVVEKEIEKLLKIRDQVNTHDKKISQNQKSIISLTQAQTATSTNAAKSQGIKVPKMG